MAFTAAVDQAGHLSAEEASGGATDPNKMTAVGLTALKVKGVQCRAKNKSIVCPPLPP